MPHFPGAIIICEVGQTDLIFGVQSGFISKWVHARLQVSVCSSYDYEPHCITPR